MIMFSFTEGGLKRWFTPIVANLEILDKMGKVSETRRRLFRLAAAPH
jgi:hypothetical protein